MPDVEIFTRESALSERAATLFTEIARESVEARGRFTVALTGGSGPKGLYQLLAKEPRTYPVDWAKAVVFLGDERFVPYDDPDSNFGMCRRLLLDHVPAGTVLPIPTGTATAQEAAATYAETLARAFAAEERAEKGRSEEGRAAPAIDLVLLGMGDDGHCASLFPGMPTLEVTDVLAVATPPGTLPPPLERVTVTFPVLNAARRVLFLVPGAGKAQAARDVLEGGAVKEQHPAAGVRPAHGAVTWLLDSAAAGLLTK